MMMMMDNNMTKINYSHTKNYFGKYGICLREKTKKKSFTQFKKIMGKINQKK